jgi:hypothetical protein
MAETAERMYGRDAGFPNRAGISAGLIRRAGGGIAGGGLHSFHGPACRYEIHGIIRGDPQVLEESRFSMDLHMLVQIGQIKLQCAMEFDLAPKQVSERKRRTNLDIFNVFTSYNKGLSEKNNPAPQFDSIGEDAVVLPQVFR